MTTHKSIKTPGARRPHGGVIRFDGRLGAVDRAARAFMEEAMGAREVMVTRIAPAGDGVQGWEVEADILVPDLAIKGLGLRLRQEVLEARRCTVRLDAAHAVQSYELTDEVER
jgi:hypothetical protein